MKPRLLLLALALGAVVPGPAVAQEGSGLYEPSPRKAAGNRADRFVKELLSAEAGQRVAGVPRRELRTGRFLSGWSAPDGGESLASGRAERGGDWLPSRPWTVAVALVLACAAVLAAGGRLALRGTRP